MRFACQLAANFHPVPPRFHYARCTHPIEQSARFLTHPLPLLLPFPTPAVALVFSSPNSHPRRRKVVEIVWSFLIPVPQFDFGVRVWIGWDSWFGWVWATRVQVEVHVSRSSQQSACPMSSRRFRRSDIGLYSRRRINVCFFFDRKCVMSMFWAWQSALVFSLARLATSPILIFLPASSPSIPVGERAIFRPPPFPSPSS